MAYEGQSAKFSDSFLNRRAFLRTLVGSIRAGLTDVLRGLQSRGTIVSNGTTIPTSTVPQPRPEPGGRQ